MSSSNNNNTIRNSTTTGAEGCPCIDASPVLASLVKRSCTTSDEQEGILLTVSGPCVPLYFGSSTCIQHDMTLDPICLVGGPDIPAYCTLEWCYVDALTCMGASSERAYRSTYFAADTGVDMFYSYSTCGSSAKDWLEREYGALGGVSMTAITASFNIVPWQYKRDYEGNIPTVPGPEYYDNSMPSEGVHIDFVRSLQGISEGDFTLDFVHGSRGNRVVHPGGPGTAAVQDVADGLVDLVVGPIWITARRLKMTSFTQPIQLDKTVLVIPRPGSTTSLRAQTQKVLDPFQSSVWILLLVTITITALLSVWFSGKGVRKDERSGRHRKIRASVLTRLAVDECLQKGTFFCSGGVEQDQESSLPQKLLMSGFAFFILIVVSAYVANLAAFLTRNVSNHIGTIEEAIASGLKICAHPVLEDELLLAHPSAHFIFNQEGKELFGLVEDYDDDECDVMAVGKMDSLGDLKLMEMFCERDLVYTESLIIENPVGFPVRNELASGFSYWMYQGEENHGINVQFLREEYDAENAIKPSCNVILSEQNDESSEFTRISAQNLIFPIMFFLGFAILAVILQLYHQWVMRKNNNNSNNVRTLVGRVSSLNLFAGLKNVGSLDKKEESWEEESYDAEARNNAVSSNAMGTLLSDSVDIDGISVRTLKKKASDRIETTLGDSDALSNGADNATLSQLDTGVLDKLDEFIACYQTIKRRKEFVGTK